MQMSIESKMDYQLLDYTIIITCCETQLYTSCINVSVHCMVINQQVGLQGKAQSITVLFSLLPKYQSPTTSRTPLPLTVICANGSVVRSRTWRKQE